VHGMCVSGNMEVTEVDVSCQIAGGADILAGLTPERVTPAWLSLS
jgi:hypothetical protein